MNNRSKPENNTATPANPGAFDRSIWLNPRRKRFWAVIVLLVYTLAGFFVVPAVLKRTVISIVADDLGRTAQIERVEFNPYVLSLSVQGFDMDDTDNRSVIAFDELFINFQLTSIFRRAWTFREIRITRPYFLFERFGAQDSRLSRMLADYAATTATDTRAEAPGQEKTGPLPRLFIEDITLSAGHIEAIDNLPATTVNMALNPINISIKALNTLPNELGEQSVIITLPDNSTLILTGSLGLVPVVSKGELILENFRLHRVIPYLKAIFPIEAFTATLSSRFKYHFKITEDGNPNIDIDGLDVGIMDVTARGLVPETDFLSISKISALGGSIRYPEQTVQFSSLNIDDPHVSLWLDENGQLSLQQLAADTGAEQLPDDEEQALPWQVGLDRLMLNNANVDFSDRSINPAAEIGVRALQINVANISNRENSQSTLELKADMLAGGTLNANANLVLFPQPSFSGSINTQDIPLSLGQAYVQQSLQILIESGLLNTRLELSMQPNGAMRVGGTVKIPGLEIKDPGASERLVGWNELSIDKFDLDLDTKSLRISKLLLDQVFGRFIIHEDQSTNFSGLLVQTSEDPSSPLEKAETSEAANFHIVVGGVSIQDGSMDMSDLSLPLPFATHITALNGSISTIDTRSTEPSALKLEGQVDEHGLARIDGSVSVQDPINHTNVKFEFRNLLMSNLSPYSAAFVGREISEGRLQLGLRYSIEDGQLKGDNDIILSDLVLGNKIDHPDAVSLPLGLAVALLTDSKGVIDIKLPVQGNVNDPEFKIGGVIFKAFSGMITRMVSAPFRLLGNLIGIDSQDFGQIDFLAGRSDLTSPEMEKIDRLKLALQKRPELSIEISGVTDPVIDSPALKVLHLRKAIAQRMDDVQAQTSGEFMILDVEIRPLLEGLFLERNPEIDIGTLKALHTKPVEGATGASPVFDQLAFAADLRDRLLAAQTVTEQDLNSLAAARAQAISSAFLKTGDFADNRIVIAANRRVESVDGQWINLELAVAPK